MANYPKKSNRFSQNELRGARAQRGVGLGKHGKMLTVGGLTPSGIKRIARLLSSGKRLQTGLSGGEIDVFQRMVKSQKKG